MVIGGPDRRGHWPPTAILLVPSANIGLPPSLQMLNVVPGPEGRVSGVEYLADGQALERSAQLEPDEIRSHRQRAAPPDTGPNAPRSGTPAPWANQRSWRSRALRRGQR